MDTTVALDNVRGNIELCRKVLEFTSIFREVVGKAKQPGFALADWAPLEALVAVNDFKRVGAFLEEMNWREYTGFVTQFATSSGWEGSFRRIHECGDVVYLELTERCTTGDCVDVVNSLTVYEFDAAAKIRRLDVYLQRKLESST